MGRIHHFAGGDEDVVATLGRPITATRSDESKTGGSATKHADDRRFIVFLLGSPSLDEVVVGVTQFAPFDELFDRPLEISHLLSRQIKLLGDDSRLYRVVIRRVNVSQDHLSQVNSLSRSVFRRRRVACLEGR